MSADARMTWGTGRKGQKMAHVISEIMLNGSVRATLMGSTNDNRQPSQVLRVRLVFVEWADRDKSVPRVTKLDLISCVDRLGDTCRTTSRSKWPSRAKR